MLKKIFLPQDLLEEFSAPNLPYSTTNTTNKRTTTTNSTINNILIEETQCNHLYQQQQQQLQQEDERNWKPNRMFYEEKDDVEDGIYIVDTLYV